MINKGNQGHDESLNNLTEQYANLKDPIPVNIVYFTAWENEEGKINFRDDIYKRDSRLMEAIFAKK